MKKKIIGRIIIISTLAFLSYWAIKRSIHTLVGAQQVVVQCSPIFAPALQQQIAKTVIALFDPIHTAWTSRVKKQFPLIDRIASTRQSNTIIITIDPIALVAIINARSVADKNGTLHELNTIAPFIHNGLAQITAHNIQPKGTQEFKQFIQQVPEALLRQYSIVWRSPFEIYLTAPQEPYRLVTRYDLIGDIQKHILAQRIAREQLPKKKIISVDLRFNKQLVIRTV